MIRIVGLSMLCLLIAAPLSSQEKKKPQFWSIGEKVEETVMPSCQDVCKHVLGMFQQGLPDKEVSALKAGTGELMKACVPSCETDLDSKARRCVMEAQDLEGFNLCQIEHQARHSTAAKPVPPATEPLAAPSTPAPSCDVVCRHILEMAVQQILGEGRDAAAADVETYLPQCVAECVTDLDDEARRCFMKAESFEAGAHCDEALELRRNRQSDPSRPFWEENTPPE